MSINSLAGACLDCLSNECPGCDESEDGEPWLPAVPLENRVNRLMRQIDTTERHLAIMREDDPAAYALREKLMNLTQALLNARRADLHPTPSNSRTERADHAR